MPGVRTTHPDYDKFAPKWKRVRDVVAGQDAMHTAGEAYLPKLKDEDPKDYDARRKRSDFFNGTYRTIDALGGMAFRKPPTVEVPNAIEALLEDINLAGMTMESLAKECTEEVLGPGRIGILIDHPPQQTDDDGKVVAITQAVAEQLGMRPTMQLYMTESIRNWKFARVNNAWVLSMVVLGECEAVPVDEFTSKDEDRYRVLDLDASGFYRQRLFKVEKEKDEQIGGDVYPLMIGKPLKFIPFVIIGAGGRNDKIDEPPLIDLVDKNVAHYQVNADYRHGLHFCGLPTPFFAGVTAPDNADGTPGKIYIGGSAAVATPDPNAKAEFLEFTGEGLSPIEKALDRIERQMALLGARMIADETAQAETLGATQIKRAGENSVLAKIVQAVSESLEWALGVFSQWTGQSGKISYQINRDFMPAMMDAQTLVAIFAGVQSGNISKQEAFELLQRGDLIDPAKPYDIHAAQVEIDTPTPARPVTPKPGEAAAA
jgi:hypothetical protein